MRTVDRDDLDRHWSGPAERKRAWPPISVVVGVISLIAAPVWIDALEAPVNPSLTVELWQDWPSLLFSAAIIVGTLLGVRTLWALNIAFSAIGTAFLLGSALTEPEAQSVGGLIFFIAGVVCLLLPSARQFEQRRVRLVLD